MRHRGRALRHRYGRTMAPFGKERTAAECLARVSWERQQARDVRSKPYGHVLAQGHVRAAEAYEKLARSKT